MLWLKARRTEKNWYAPYPWRQRAAEAREEVYSEARPGWLQCCRGPS